MRGIDRPGQRAAKNFLRRPFSFDKRLFIVVVDRKELGAESQLVPNFQIESGVRGSLGAQDPFGLGGNHLDVREPAGRRLLKLRRDLAVVLARDG